MRNKMLVILGLALFLMGCGTKKRTVSAKKPTVVTAERTKPYEPNKDLGKTKFNKSELYPMPADPGYFKRFPIATTQEYIDVFAQIAQYEMRAFGIPASITLAQGILESGSGKGQLTQKTNNHFGIKCHTGWQGDFDFHDDDAKGECFRKYNHPMFSFRDHSIFLASRSRYRFLFNFKRDDYKKWAHGLKKAGYATDKKYPQKLIALIERYQLDQYDDKVFEQGLQEVRDTKTYDVFTHVVAKGDTLYGISRRYGVSIEEIKRLNRLKDNTLSIGQTINLRKAKTK
nr:glucosaminidase domain-containing protein [Croceitalea dokdonensis]